METTVTLTLNREPRSVTTDGSRPLLDVIREEFHLTGTKYGCGEGHCGACTVLVEGKRERSCQWSISEAAGKKIMTIEALAPPGALHPVQEAFISENAAQCGYCTSGMVLSAVALLEEKPSPSDAEIMSWMNGHICRCCGYANILNAVRAAAAQRKEARR